MEWCFFYSVFLSKKIYENVFSTNKIFKTKKQPVLQTARRFT